MDFYHDERERVIMRYWILKTDSTSSHFTLARVSQSYEYLYQNSDGDNLIQEGFNTGDKLFVFRDDPTNRINFLLEAIDKFKFRKTHELEGISKETIINLLPATEDFLEQSNDKLLYSLKYDDYKILLEAFLQSGNILNKTKYVKPSTPVPYSHNRIIFGAPGTGKSFLLEQQRKKFFGHKFERVTFYPNYTYGQFFGTYKPIKESDTKPITYEFVPGPFFRLLVQAYDNPSQNYLLIIEEINRANAAAVFGDIFQLLDRDDNGVSDYKIKLSQDAIRFLDKNYPHLTSRMENLTLPDNFYIWSTMNSADQGVQPLDSAFKRRFDFEYININANQKVIENISVNIPGVDRQIDWNQFRKVLNSFLIKEFPHVKEDKLIGPFFIKLSVLKSEQFEKAFKNKLLMYLFEDVLKTGNREKLFNARTYSTIIEIYEAKHNLDRKIFSQTFYKELNLSIQGNRTDILQENSNDVETNSTTTIVGEK